VRRRRRQKGVEFVQFREFDDFVTLCPDVVRVETSSAQILLAIQAVKVGVFPFFCWVADITKDDRRVVRVSSDLVE